MAGKLKFRAEAVLKLRQQREELARRDFARTQQEVLDLQQGILRIRQEMARQDDAVREGMLTGTVDVQYMSLYRRHLMVLHRSAIQQTQQLQDAAERMQQARGQLLDAAQQRKVMEKLKENLQQRHRLEQDRIERHQADELASMRFAGRRQERGQV